MKKLILLIIGIVLVGILGFVFTVTASVLKLDFNSPSDGEVGQDNFKFLNITVYNNDTSQGMDVKIYGGDNSVVANNSLIFRQSNVTNGTTITFNWTSSKLAVNDNTVLLMYFDSQTAEGNWSEIPIDDNMVLYFKFNNDSGVGESYANVDEEIVYDYSNAQKSGTNTGDVAIWSPTGGRFGGAFDFDGADNRYIQVVDDAADDPLDIADEITIELWLDPDSFGSEEDILFKDASYTVQLGTASPFDSIRWGVNVSGSFRYLTTPIGILNSGAFQHVAVTYNISSRVQRIYVQGREITSITLSALSDYNISTNNNNLLVGSDGSAPNSDTFDGRIDQVIIYNRTLSADEIREHANTKLIDETGINNGTRFKYDENLFNYSGKLGPALEFDGVDDFVSINDSNSLDLNESFSISFWTYPTTLNKNQTFLAKGSGTTANYFINYKTTSQLEFGFYNGGLRSLFVNASSITVNQWNLITVTRNDSSNISRVYINGINKGDSPLNFDVLTNDFDLKIGSFPEFDQNFTGLIDELVIYNKTLNSSEVTEIYQLKEGTWYWKFSGEDSDGINISSTRSFLIGTIWEVSPAVLDSVGVLLNTNVSVGTLFINNTHGSRNITINITHDFNGTVTFNESLPLNLTNFNVGNNSISIQINVTSPSVKGSTTINFNISATDSNTGENSAPAFRIVPVDLIASSGDPFLITAFETAPSIVSQNNTGISLKASVVNKGQGDAQDVKITFELPDGWTNSSGALTSSGYSVNVNQQRNHSIEVDVAANAIAGIVTLYANVTGKNESGSYINSSLKTIGYTNVTVNEISLGVVSPVVVSAPSGGGGGGGGVTLSGGGTIEADVFAETIEIIRGGDALEFDIEVTPNYVDTSLINLTLVITGFPEQYIEISPEIISLINYGEIKSFTVLINAPIYKGYEEHELEVVITGIVLNGGGNMYSYVERRPITLVIQEVDYETSFNLLEKAKEFVSLMKEEGYNINYVQELLELAQDKLDQRINNAVYDLAEEIIEIKDKAFFVNDFIRGLIEIERNPRKSHFLAGNVVDAIDKNGGVFSFITGNVVDEGEECLMSDVGCRNSEKEVPLRNLITGKVTFSSESSVNFLNMAIIAFERGDYNLAEDRAKSAQSLLLLERKGNFGLFLYLYWQYIFALIIIFGLVGMFSYRRYQKFEVIRKVDESNVEEQNIQEIMVKTQQDYFSGKISPEDYKKTLSDSKKHLGEVKEKRSKLRSKRLGIIKAKQLLEHLEIEKTEVEDRIKKLQTDYYLDRKISEEEYRFQFEILIERLAEIEEEKTTIEIKEDSVDVSNKNKQGGKNNG
jgi:hypothetical protein